MRRKRNFSCKTRRQLNLESLESRHVLTSIVPADAVGFQVAENSGEQTIRLNHQDIALAGDAEFGAISQDENGALRYTPADEFLGVDSFQFTYTAAGGETVTDTAYINVTESIYALPDWMQVAPDTESTVLDVLANDYLIRGIDRADVNIVGFEDTVNGMLTLSEDGRRLIYEPNANFRGIDEFTYTTRDALGNESTATASIDVTEKAGTGQFSNLEHFYVNMLSERVRALQNSFGAPTVNLSVLVDLAATDRVNVDSSGSNVGLFDGMMMRANSQVAGVDEGDIVQRDGNRLYVAVGNELRIADITDPSNPTLMETISFDDPIAELYSYKGRITVVTDSSVGNNIPIGNWTLVDDMAYIPRSVDAEFGIHVLELSEDAGFELVYSTQLDGDFHDSRFIDGTLYVVSNQSAPLRLSQPELVTVGDVEFRETISDYVERTGVEAATFGAYQTTNSNGPESGSLFQIEDLNTSILNVNGISSVTTFDTTGQDGAPIDADALALLANVELYASTDAIYLLSNVALPDDVATANEWSVDNPGTNIQKLDIAEDGTGVELVASGIVRGSVSDQFSADENNGYFRIATTTFNSVVDLFVLEQVESDLSIVGSIEDIAPNESIYSTRFDGDRAFITTFRQVDPLFVIDLSDPTSPKIDGELKIPSYSNYLQVINEDYVLGIGRDANGGMFEGLQISLFNVSDPADPQLVAKHVFEGGRDTWSSVANAWDLLDYQAVTFDAESGILAIPTHTSYQWGGGSESGIDEAISVLKVDIASETIELVGDIDFNNRVNRSLKADGLLFGISDNELRIVNVLNPSEAVSSLDLTGGTATSVDDLPLFEADATMLSDVNTDVDQDGATTPMDAQILVNMVEEHGFAEMTPNMDEYCDVDRDGHFSPLDFLAVINALNDGSEVDPVLPTELEASQPTTMPGTSITTALELEMGPFQTTLDLEEPLEEQGQSQTVTAPVAFSANTASTSGLDVTSNGTSDQPVVGRSTGESLQEVAADDRETTGSLLGSNRFTVRSNSTRGFDSTDEDEAEERVIDLLFGQIGPAEFARLG